MAESRTKIILEATDRTAAAFASAKSGISGVSSAASTANRLLATFGVALSAASLTAFISKGVNAAAALGDLSTRTGVAVRDLAGLQLVAKQSDTSIEALGKGVNKLGVFMVENSKAAKELGLTAKAPLDAFIQLSGTLSSIQDVQLRNAVANKVLGKSYEELLPAILQGPEALRRQIEEGQRYNRITQGMADESKRFNDSLDLLGVQLTSVSATVGGPMVTALNVLIEKFREARNQGDGFFESLRKGLVAGADGGELADVERNLAFLGIRKSKTEEFLNRRFVSASAKEQAKKDLAEIESQIRASTARMELLMHDAFRFKPGKTAAPSISKGDEEKIKAALGGGASDELKRKTESNAKYVESLRQQAEMLGMNAVEAEIYKATQKKLNDEQMRSVEIYAQKIADQKESEQSLKDALHAEEDANKALIAGKQVLIGLEKDFQTEIEKRRLALNAPLLPAADRKLAEDLLEITKSAQDARVELEKLNASGSLSAGAYAERLQQVTEAEERQKEAVRELATEQNALNASWKYGAGIALRDYLDEVNNTAKHAKEMFAKSFKGAEDALVDFVKTGKLIFRSLADSIISDLIRISVQQTITRPLAEAFGGSLLSGIFGSAQGNVFSANSGLSAYRNSIVSKPTIFPFAKGIGLMGEKSGSPGEAIMPLFRMPGGDLGVKAAGGGGDTINVTINVSTGVSQTVRAEIVNLMPVIKGEVMSAVVDAKRRGGSFGSAFS